ncbi:exosomal core protein csl4 [Diaporthe eres]|uniref:S1 motif domain-containing protein n=1 Tax=Diaporthe vaccinii TaxID=105482 RepID=A0ABR4E479_9PEZI|nr:exosomal core protein csl4 [Diaporthe eres]
MAATTLAIPGQLLGAASKYKPGPGVHLYESNLYSSLLGSVAISQPASQSSSSSSSNQGLSKRITRITQNLPSRAAGGPGGAPSELPTISVSRGARGGGSIGGAKQQQREVLPQVGNTVLCRVTRITPRQAVVAILVCGETVLGAEWQGVIRVQDVRATEKDRVKVYESFRPGDIVRASVISLGDQANYYLSTASNELGVIMAVSEAGNAMYPVTWKEYKDPETGLSERRKVAKPF